MKKTAISLMLVLAMVVSFVLVAAPVASAENAHNHSATTSHCACNDSLAGKHTCDILTDWKALKWVNTDPESVNTGTFYIGGNAVTFSSNKYTLAAGKHNFYLTEDTRLGPGFFVVPSGAEVTVCLNGYMFFGRDTFSSVGRLFDIQGGTVNIVDCGSGGVISGQAGGESSKSTAVGGVFYIRGNNSTLNIFSGEVRYQASECFAKGGLIYCPSGKTGVSVNIFGGTLKGAKSNVEGDILYLSSGTLNLQGGTLMGGPNANALGAVYVTSAGSIKFAGGKIVSGSDAGKVVVWGDKSLSMGITKMGLAVKEDDTFGISYTAEYNVSDSFKSLMTADGYKYGIKVEADIDGGKSGTAGCDDTDLKKVTVHLANMLNGDDKDDDDAKTPVVGNAFVMIDKTTVESAPKRITMKTMLEAMDAQFGDSESETYNENALLLLATVYDKFGKKFMTEANEWVIPFAKAKADALNEG